MDSCNLGCISWRMSLCYGLANSVTLLGVHLSEGFYQKRGKQSQTAVFRAGETSLIHFASYPSHRRDTTARSKNLKPKWIEEISRQHGSRRHGIPGKFPWVGHLVKWNSVINRRMIEGRVQARVSSTQHLRRRFWQTSKASTDCQCPRTVVPLIGTWGKPRLIRIVVKFFFFFNKITTKATWTLEIKISLWQKKKRKKEMKFRCQSQRSCQFAHVTAREFPFFLRYKGN